MWTLLLILIYPFTLLITNVNLHPAPSSLCHGSLPGIQYQYEYHSNIILNNNDNLEPAGFRVKGQVILENVWQDKRSYLALIELRQFKFEPRESSSSTRFFDTNAENVDHNWPPVLVHINGHDGHLQNLFVEKSHDNHHHLIEPTQLNLIVSIMNALRNRRDQKSDNQILPYEWELQGRHLIRRKSVQSELMEDFGKYSLLAPLITDNWEIESELAIDHDISEHVKGWQNVTLESKIYPNAHSKLFVNFELKLISQHSSAIVSTLSKAQSISQAVYLFGHHVRSKSMASLGPSHFQAERKPCQPHFCQSLSEFIQEYKRSLAEDHSLATNSMSVAFLRLLNYIRINSHKISRKDVAKLLQQLEKSRRNDDNIWSTLMDTIAASRHGDAMLAALDHLNLPKCQGDDRVGDCERFLVVTAISGSTVANMGSSYVAEHSLSVEQLLDLFVPLLSNGSWADHRVRNSFAMTVATLLHSYRTYVKTLSHDNFNNQSIIADHIPYESSRMTLRHHSSPTQFVDVSPESNAKDDKPDLKSQNHDRRHHQQKLLQISEKIIKQLQRDLDSCKDVECRIVYLHALGNTRIISKFGMLNTLKRYVINGGKRESVAAMRAMRDCVETEFESNAFDMNEKLSIRLRQLLVRILYDSNLETTTRLIASELLANVVDRDGDITIELIKHLDKFPSELATMIWKRAVQNVLLKRRQNRLPGVKSENWHLHSKILSGSSASFRYVMGGTGYANASYGVFLELLKGKLPKETSFNVDISRDNQMYQDIINVGLFARGLQSFAGESDDGDEDDELSAKSSSDDEESTMAGMTLHVLGQQLRPLIFFRSTSELMGHVWSGTGSEPTSVFRANLLLADYLDVKPLINGFLVEQTLKGVFSIDLNGEIQISIWNRNSHSNVQTKGAILFQGSQEIYAATDRTKTSAKKMFSFGAEAQLNFITDFDFYSSPYRICIQITQPEFIFRHNTRKYEQVHSDHLHRRIHRRSYKIPAKSYMLNRDNSEMCAIMNGNDNNGGINGGNGGQEDNFFSFD